MSLFPINYLNRFARDPNRVQDLALATTVVQKYLLPYPLRLQVRTVVSCTQIGWYIFSTEQLLITLTPVFLSRTHAHALTHTHTLTHTHIVSAALEVAEASGYPRHQQVPGDTHTLTHTHSLTHSLTHAYSLTHSHTHSLLHSLTHSLKC